MDISFTVPMAGGKLPDAILFMPEGTHEICATVDGEAQRVKVIVDRSCLACLQRDLEEKLKENVKPVVLFKHNEDGPAAFIPSSFDYIDGKGPVLLGEWSASGGNAILGRDFGYFSPRFNYSWETCRPVGLLDGIEVGSLVNSPAFEKNARIAASKPSAQGPAGSDDRSEESRDSGGTQSGEETGTTRDTTMFEQLAKLGIMTQDEIKSENAAAIAEERLNALKSEKADTSALEAAKKELDETKKELGECQAAKARVSELEAQVSASKAELESVKKDKEALIEAEITSAVSAGKIADKDDAAKSALRSALTADITAGKALINSMSPNPAFSSVVAGKAAAGNEALMGRERMIKSFE